MKLKDINYYGIRHDRVLERFEGDLEYLGYICYRDKPMACYRAHKPDRAKGHKDIMLLMEDRELPDGEAKLWVAGMDLKEFKKHVKHNAVGCLACEQVIYSLHRHHYQCCDCGNAFVDGGKDYFRAGGKDLERVAFGIYNVLTGIYKRGKRNEYGNKNRNNGNSETKPKTKKTSRKTRKEG